MTKTIWMPSRRRFIATTSTLALAGLAAPALAQTRFPSRPVTLIVPWTAGGSTDMGFRALAEASQKHLGERIIVENKPGAGGRIALGQVKNSKPDGQTVIILPSGPMVLFPHVYKNLGYDAVKDFTPSSEIACHQFGFGSGPSRHAKEGA